jgi:DNA-binding MarR family transcriptional regulator
MEVEGMGHGDRPESLNSLLVQICKLHHARAHSLLDELGLYRGQPPLLHVLVNEEGQSHSELAARLHVTPATMSKMVSRMEKAGVVRTGPDPDDQRVSRVYLTDHGRDLHRQAQAQMEQLEIETFRDLSEEERSLLQALMEQMRDNLIRVVDEKALVHPHRHKGKHK